MATKTNVKDQKKEQNNKKSAKKMVYQNPAESIVGKIVIWALVAAMALGGIATIIAVIVQALK